MADVMTAEPRTEFSTPGGVDWAEVARLVATKRWSEVAAEVAKCDIRCANCHRKRTARQFGWIKLALQIERSAATTTEAYNVDARE